MRFAYATLEVDNLPVADLAGAEKEQVMALIERRRLYMFGNAHKAAMMVMQLGPRRPWS